MEEHPARLILVDLAPELGAAERLLWELATRLPRERYEVHAWLSSSPEVDGLASELSRARLSVERFDSPIDRWSWRTTFGFWLRLRREKPDLIHAHQSCGSLVLRVAGIAATEGIPTVLTRHAAAGASRPGDRQPLKRIDRLVVATRAGAEDVARECGLERARVSVIPYGADPPDEEFERPLARAWRTQLGARLGVPLFVCPLRPEPGRGHDTLLEALAELSRRGLGFVVGIPGEGSRRAELERHAAALGLSDAVCFVGDVGSLDSLVLAADAVVLPMTEGPVPLALLTALARGRPIVASAVPGVDDVIEDGMTGRLVPPGDAAALADVLEQFHRRSDLALRLGREAAAEARDELTWPHVVEAYEDVYDEVLGIASFVPENARSLARS